MNFFNKRNEVDYTPPLDLLGNIEPMVNLSNDTEVMFTLGEQEVVRQNDKYFLGNIVNPSVCKEITRDTAYELMRVEEQQRIFKTPKIYED